MKKKLLAILLTVAMLAVSVLPAHAIGAEQFISDVALIYKDSVEDAKKAIEGTDWLLYEQDLNPDADYMFDDGVYLIYKTTTNVEEAITDLRVMNMHGGYSISDYKRELANARKAYMALISDIRVAIDEFKALYEAGDAMAKLAHRQMNYYKDVGETDMLMGDFLLNIPSDEAFVTVMMEGNSFVFSNLITLIAIGLSGASDKTLTAAIAEKLEIKDSLSANQYYESAAMLSEQLEGISGSLIKYEAAKDSFNVDDEEMSEEEFLFMTEYGALATMFEAIPYGKTSLKDFVVAGDWEISDLYPLAAALSPGQIAIASLGQLPTIIQYSSPTKPIDELYDIVETLEKDMTDENGSLRIFDVYTGVDRSIFEGKFAFTSEAERQQSLTGEFWSPMDNFEDYLPTIPNIILVSLSATSVMTPVVAALVSEFILKPLLAQANAWGLALWRPLYRAIDFLQYKLIFNKYIFTGISFGLLLVAAGVTAIHIWYDYYNPDYTAIPDVLIDVRETDLGNKFIKYSAAGVFGEDGKNADFNAYQGKEWIALYYTKDATAGNCLTPNFVTKQDNATVSRRHQGVSMFGETDAFDLNSHVFNEDAPSVYLSVRYSATKKEAADLPDVVGSIIGVGSYAIVAGCGLFAGMGIMAFSSKKKKKTEQEASASNTQ